MTSNDQELSEKIRLIAMTLGSYAMHNKFYLVGDDAVIELLKKPETWIKKTENLSVEYVVERHFKAGQKETFRTESFQLSANGILFPKIIYRSENGKIYRAKSNWWEDELNNLHIKATRLNKWHEDVAKIKKSMSIADRKTCLTNPYSTQ